MRLSNSHPSLQFGITTCQDTCRNIGLKVRSLIRKCFSKVVPWCDYVMMWSFLDILKVVLVKNIGDLFSFVIGSILGVNTGSVGGTLIDLAVRGKYVAVCICK